MKGGSNQRSRSNIPPAAQPRNRLLASLPARDRSVLEGHLQQVSFTRQQTVYSTGQPIPFVHFPLSGIFSLTLGVDDGRSVEVATVGNEGVIGALAFLGATTLPVDVICLVPGDARRLGVDWLRRELRAESALFDAVRRYLLALVLQIIQSAACNRLHTVEQRLARWLLIVQDRCECDRVPETQQLLSSLLGVRRPTISIAAHALEEAHTIACSRGAVTVLDRAALERLSCECYGIIRRFYEELLPSVPPG
jgi:CRP-like cAMP-binding protein